MSLECSFTNSYERLDSVENEELNFEFNKNLRAPIILIFASTIQNGSKRIIVQRQKMQFKLMEASHSSQTVSLAVQFEF